MVEHGGYAFEDEVTAMESAMEAEMATFIRSLNTGTIKAKAGQATSSSGYARFYLTDTGTGGGTAQFASILSVNTSIENAATAYVYHVISVDRKYVDAFVFSNPVVSVLGINVLGSPSVATNGVVIHFTVLGT